MTDSAHFDQCTDDGPFDEAAWSTVGHFDPSLPLLMRLARSVSYDTGYSPAEVTGLLRTVRWSKGYVGKHPTMYDLVPCDEEGIAESHQDDDGNEINRGGLADFVIDAEDSDWHILEAVAGPGHVGNVPVSASEPNPPKAGR